MVRGKAWSACGGSCQGYGTPIGAGDFDDDRISDVLFQNGSTLTVLLQDGSGGFRAQPLSRTVPWSFALAGLRSEYGRADLVWYSALTGLLQVWHVDISGYVRVENVSWQCNDCSPNWEPVGLIPFN